MKSIFYLLYLLSAYPSRVYAPLFSHGFTRVTDFVSELPEGRAARVALALITKSSHFRHVLERSGLTWSYWWKLPLGDRTAQRRDAREAPGTRGALDKLGGFIWLLLLCWLVAGLFSPTDHRLEGLLSELLTRPQW